MENLIKLAKHFEGLHDGDLKVIGTQPKMDPVGIWTEGYGRAMINPKTGKYLKGNADKKLAYKYMTIHNEQQAHDALIQDLKPFLLLVERKVTVELQQHQKEALALMYYNCGYSATLTSLINNKAPIADIVKWWTTHYVTGQGNPTPLKGLVRRRKSEAYLFETGTINFFE